jgi:hypothetical protein
LGLGWRFATAYRHPSGSRSHHNDRGARDVASWANRQRMRSAIDISPNPSLLDDPVHLGA